jgi:hypothetical protein
MTTSLSGFAWLTFVGTNGIESAPNGSLNLIQAAPDGSLWVSGSTTRSAFPAYLVHLSTDGSHALASTYLPAHMDGLGRHRECDFQPDERRAEC